MHNSNSVGINTKQLVINMVASIIAFILNFGINFFITPYITGQFGSDAYGFVKLANDFISYASLVSIALNSMASRFLMLAREGGDIELAKKYFSSIHLANIVLSGIFVIPSVICIIFLEHIVSIPSILVYEVKLTFALTFVSFLYNLFYSTYSNCFYISNRLSIGSIRESVASIIRVLVILSLFAFATPRISYVAVGGLIATIFSVIYNKYYSYKLLPEFRFKIQDFQWKKVVEVLAAGVWNSITKLSQILTSGLDLIVTNIFIGSTEMGYLAVAKTIPNVIVSFNATVANVFSPNMMSLYAKGDVEALKKTSKVAMKFMCMFVTIPNAILIMMGEDFFRLWVPTEPAKLLCILSILTVINSCVTGPLTPLYQIFTITNKVKQNSIVMIGYGLLNIIITFVCLQHTNLGLYAVAGVSLIGSVIVALCYHLPFSAIHIGLPWYTFFPEIWKGVISLCMQCCICAMVQFLLDFELSWVTWFVAAGISACIGLGVNFYIVLNKEERAILIHKLKLRIKREC